MVCGINIQEIEHGMLINNDSDLLGMSNFLLNISDPEKNGGNWLTQSTL